MIGSISRLFNYRVRALIRKEAAQIRRDRRLAFSLILPPTLQLLLLGFALSATVTNVKLGAVDDSRTPESRELIATLGESKSFRLVSFCLYGCFSKPLAVVYGGTSPAVSEDLA